MRTVQGMRTEQEGARGVFATCIAASMWVVAIAGVASAPLRNQASLFRRSPESTSYALVAAAETSSCSMPGICW